MRFIALLSLLLLHSSARAQDGGGAFSPAVFREDRSIEQYIKVPASPENFFIVVPCVAMVEINGQLGNPSCIFSSDNAVPYIKAIQVASEKARLVPARVDGMRRRVNINFNIRFSRETGPASVSVALNHGRNAAIYGEDYIEPQVFDWPSAGVEERCVRPPNLIWVVALVGSDGIPITSRVDAPQASADCRTWAIDYMSRWKFIPGIAHGKPVDALTGHLFRDAAAEKTGVPRNPKYRWRP